MQQKYFLFAFGVNGDQTEIPDALDPSGFVSYQEGFTFDYERNPASDPLAKDILRNNYNAVLFDVTSNIQDYQQHGFPDWITSANNGGVAFPYDQGAVVRWQTASGQPWNIYQSLVANNTQTPGAGASQWSLIPNTNTINFPVIPMSIPGGSVTIRVNQVLLQFYTADIIHLPASFAGSVAYCSTPATNPWTAAIEIGGTNVGTLNFAAGSHTGTFTGPGSVTTLTPGAVSTGLLQIVAPGTADPTLAGVSITMKGTT